MCVNLELFCSLSNNLFKLRPQFVDPMCKTPWLSPQLVYGVIDLDFRGQIQIASQNLIIIGFATRLNTQPLE